MTQTTIICLSIIAIVALICYTSYKIHTFKANHKTLDEINQTLGWLKSNYKLNSDMLDEVWDSIQEIKLYLKEIVKYITK